MAGARLDKRWYGAPACRVRVRAPIAEHARPWWAGGAVHEREASRAAAAGELRVRHGDRLAKKHRARVAGSVDHLVRRTLLDDDAVEHHEHASRAGAVTHHAEVVAHDEIGLLALSCG
jgi:hypothetical protein